MFDLESEIARWRRQMQAAGIQTPAALDELEVHLREEIEQLVKTDVDSPSAFNIAAKKIGPAAALKLEFKKVGASPETRFVQLAGVACATVAGLFLAWTVFVLFFRIHEISRPARVFGLMAVPITLLSWMYGPRFLPVIRHRLARAAAGMTSCAAGMIWVCLFLQYLLPRLFEVPAGGNLSVDRLMVSFLWTWAALGILAGIAWGLEKAADRDGVAAGS